MLIDRVVHETIKKKNPCIVGIDPEWNLIPACYKQLSTSPTEVIWLWAKDVIDSVSDIVIAVKPQMAFYEIYGSDGFRIFEKIAAYARSLNLIVIDDSKRNDIGNTAQAYAFAHLSEKGPIRADVLTVSPFLGLDSIQPFINTAQNEDKGIFVLVRTSNPGSSEIAESINSNGLQVSFWLSNYLADTAKNNLGNSGYSAIGAVVGATFPKEAQLLRKIMKQNYFLVPGYGAQGGSAEDITACFNSDGLGALVSSSRGILYEYKNLTDYDDSAAMYRQIIKNQSEKMRQEIYQSLKNKFKNMIY